MLSIVFNPDEALTTADGREAKLHGFVADWYADHYPDVAKALTTAKVASVEQHFLTYGASEGRFRNNIEWLKGISRFNANGLTIDNCVVSDSGRVMILGWSYLEVDRSTCVHVSGGNTSVVLASPHVRSYRRPDVEKAMPHFDPTSEYGFMICFSIGAGATNLGMELVVEMATRDQIFSAETKLSRTSDRGLLTTFLGFVDQKQKHGAYWAGHYEFLHGAPAAFARSIFRDVIGFPAKRVAVRCFGDTGNAKYSHIIVIYRKCDLLPLQCALLGECAKLTNIQTEILIAVNGAEIADEVMHIVEVARMTRELPIKVVVIPQNVGFGEANNICANLASAPMLLITNPDVFPMDSLLYEHIDECLGDASPKDIVGGWLYYADGSVMHVGMSVVYDTEVLRSGEQVSLPRVVHDFKGHSQQMLESAIGRSHRREVEAITGGWLIIRREAFLDIGGFCNDFIFGHYEDAEFCFRARSKGYRSIVDSRIRLWHLEGHGSESKSPSALGAQIVNRISFAEKLRALRVVTQ